MAEGIAASHLPLQVPGKVLEQIKALVASGATGHITLHIKEGKVLQIETLVKQQA